jgi:succinoglycan biosynthesis transport protein ExoP
MSLIQFVRIFWARRWLIVAATVSCLVGALLLTLLLPPRWESHARVMLDDMKPDPVTGQIIGTQEGRVFAATQVELITDNG